MGSIRINNLSMVRSKDLKCNGCGTCCSVFSNVDVHITDIFRISEFLGITPEDFFNGYCKVAGEGDDSRFVLDVDGGCKFRSGDKCSIYPVRPDMCSLYPFDFPSFSLSESLKRDMCEYEACFVHSLKDGLLILPEIEQMVDSCILFTIKEMYMAVHGSTFHEEEARRYHNMGLSWTQNRRMREVMHKKVLDEFLKNAPKSEDAAEPILSVDDIVSLYNYLRNCPSNNYTDNKQSTMEKL